MRLLATLLLTACLCTLGIAQADTKSALPRSTPEAQGISSAALSAIIDEATQKIDAIHSIMIVRHGQVVAEAWWTPYAANEPHVLFSLSKSFTSTAVGLAVAEGKLSIDDSILKFFPEDAPKDPSDKLKEMRVRDLLMMSTGQEPEEVDKVNFMSPEPATKQFLALPVKHKPGTLFYYNTPASYMLSAIVQKVTGQTTLEYLKPRLFAPLGIENPTWGASAQGISFGGFGLNLCTEDIARFGQLYLQRGEWQGRRILPAAWVDLATSRQASNGSSPDSDWDQGYGFQFWRCRNGFYRADGAFGQFCIVMPQYDTVVAITSGTSNMPGVMNLLWTKLVPELRPAALPADDASVSVLQKKIASLALPTVKGTASSAIAASVSGKTYRFPENPAGLESLAVNFDETGLKSVLRRAGTATAVSFGFGSWTKGGLFVLNQSGIGTSPMAATGAWTSSDTYTGKICMYGTPFTMNISLRFADGQLFLEQSNNIGFGPQQVLKLTGKTE